MRRHTKGHDESPMQVGEASVVAASAKAAGLESEADLGYGIPLSEVRDGGLRSRAAPAGIIG